MRRPRYRTLREDYVEFCGGNTVAALLLDYLAGVERVHDEARTQGEQFTAWRPISGKYGGLVTVLQPAPKRQTVYAALTVLINAGLIEAHPDNGKPTEINTTPTASRFRLITGRLLEMEQAWAAESEAEVLSAGVGGVLYGTGGMSFTGQGPVLYGTHESVKGIEKKEYNAPPPQTDAFEPPDVSALRNDTVAHMNGYTLIQAYSDVTGIPGETLWQSAKKVAAGLARAGITPEDVREFILEKKRDPARYDGYRFNYMSEDLPRWKMQQTAKPAPRVESDVERAQREAVLEAERLAWQREQGLL